MNRSRFLFMRKNFSGIKIIPFYFFFAFVSFPKNLLKYCLYGEIKHLKAYIKSLMWQFNSKYKYVDK